MQCLKSENIYSKGFSTDFSWKPAASANERVCARTHVARTHRHRANERSCMCERNGDSSARCKELKAATNFICTHTHSLSHYLWMQYSFPVQSVAFFPFVRVCIFNTLCICESSGCNMCLCILFFLFISFCSPCSFPSLSFASWKVTKKDVKGISVRYICCYCCGCCVILVVFYFKCIFLKVIEFIEM